MSEFLRQHYLQKNATGTAALEREMRRTPAEKRSDALMNEEADAAILISATDMPISETETQRYHARQLLKQGKPVMGTPEVVGGERTFGQNYRQGFAETIAPLAKDFGGVGARFAQRTAETPPSEGLGGAAGRATGYAAQSAAAMTAGPVVGPMLFGAQAAGQYLDERANDSTIGFWNRVGGALGMATSEAATEFIGLGALGRLVKGIGTSGAARLVKDFAVAEFANIGEEEANALAQEMVKVATGEQTAQQAWDNFVAAAPQVAGDTALMTLFFGAGRAIGSLAPGEQGPPTREQAVAEGRISTEPKRLTEGKPVEQPPTTAQGPKEVVPAEKVATKTPVQTAETVKQQIRAVAKSDEEAGAAMALLEARAESAGETLDEYVGKRIAGVEKGGTPAADALKQSQENAPIWYSKLSQVVEQKMGGAMDANQLRAMLANNGVKQEELEWSRIGDLEGKVTKQQVIDHLAENAVRVTEKMLGETKPVDTSGWSASMDDARDWSVIDESGNEVGFFVDERGIRTPEEAIAAAAKDRSSVESTRFGGSSTTIPGGENYRELLLTLPAKKLRGGSVVEREDGGGHKSFTVKNAEGDTLNTYSSSYYYNNYSPQITVEAAVAEAKGRAEHHVQNLSTEGYNSQKRFTSSHFSEPNILAHVRMNDRTGPNGEKILFIEEIQSDWHQQGRDKGYRGDEKPFDQAEYDKLSAMANEKGQDAFRSENPEQYRRLAELNDLKYGTPQGVPNAPFKKTWHELALKRSIRYAAENGYDSIAWTTGEQQAERYDLSKQVNSIEWYWQDRKTGRKIVRIHPISGNAIELAINKDGVAGGISDLPSGTEFDGKHISDIVGKDIGKQILDNEHGTLSGSGLKVGGEGMKGFYDKIIPAAANSLGKKHGARVGTTDIRATQKNEQLAITWDSGVRPTDDSLVSKLYSIANSKAGVGESEYVPVTYKKQATDVALAVDNRRMTFEDAVSEFGSVGLLERLGASGEWHKIPSKESVHSLPITDSLRNEVLTKGQPLFQGDKGSIEFLEDGRAIIRAFESSDISTLVHEIGHLFRRDLQGDMLTTAEKWAGVKDGKWTRESEERFARGFERYLRTGKSPRADMQKVFDQFKKWLSSIYSKITGSAIDVKIPPEMRKVYDDLLAAQESTVEPEARPAAVATEDAVLESNEQQPSNVSEQFWKMTDAETLREDNAIVTKNNRNVAGEGLQESLAVARDNVAPFIPSYSRESSGALASPARSLAAPAFKTSPVTTRIAPAPIAGGEVKQLSRITLDLSKSLGRTIRVGKPRARRALGTYTPASADLVIRFAGDLDTTAHEVAHALDDEFGLVADWSAPRKRSPFDAELIPHFSQFGSVTTSGPKSTLKYQRAEGVAEWIRAWIINPDEAMTAAPQFAKHFMDTVPDKTMKALEQFSQDVRQWAGLPASQQTLANIEIEPPSVFRRWKDNAERRGFKFTFGDRLKREVLDNLAPLWKGLEFARHLQGVEDAMIPASQDAKVLIRLLAGFDTYFGQVLENGPVDARRQHVKGLGGLPWLFEPADHTSKQTLEDDLGKMYSYMVAERTIEEANSLREAVKQVKQWQTESLRAPTALEALLGRPASPEEIAARRQELNDQIRETMKRSGYDGAIDNFGSWVTHKVERLSGIGAGLKSDEVQAIETVEEIRRGDPAQLARIEELARRYRAWSDSFLQYAVDKGLKTQEWLDDLRARHQHYVSLQRVFEEFDPEGAKAMRGGKNLGSSSEITYRFHGSTRTIQNPIISLLMQGKSIMREADRNEAMRTFVDEFDATRAMYQGSPLELAEVARKVSSDDRNAIKVMREGEAEYWQFQQEIHDVLKGLGTEGPSPLVWRIITALPRVMRSAITHSPAFAIRNVQRDIEYRVIITDAESHLWDSAYMLNPRIYREMRRDLERYGGGMFGYYKPSRRQWYKEMKRAMKSGLPQQNGIIALPGQLAQGYLGLLKWSETSGRVAEYKAAFEKYKAMGWTDVDAGLRAAYDARNLLDFAVAGRVVKFVNQAIPFTNAAIRGIHRTTQAIKDHPTRTLARLAIYTFIPTALEMLWAFLGDDEDEWAQLPAYQKDFFWNFKVGPDFWIRIPKPFELGLPSSALGRAISGLRGQEDPFEGFFGSVRRAMIPVDESALLGPLQVLAEMMTNHDIFRDKAIIPPWEEGAKLELRDTSRASNVSKVMSEVIPSDPRMLDHFIEGQFGGLGRIATQTSNLGREDAPGARYLFMEAGGIFKSTPAYNAKDVQWLFEDARLNQKSLDPRMKRLGQYLESYFDAKTATDRQRRADALRNYASKLRNQIERSGW